MTLTASGQIGVTVLLSLNVSLPAASGIGRPASVADPRAAITTLLPPTGYRAQPAPPPLPPVLEVSFTRVTDTLGHTITLALVNNIAPIYYTLDNSTPSATKPRYLTPIRVTGAPGQSFTLKYIAIALDGSGFANSVVSTVALQIPQQPDLTFDVSVGTAALTRVIAILSDIAGAFEIHYTIDGTLPTLLKPLYTVPFTVTGTSGGSIRIKAIAFPTAPLGATGGILQSDLEDVLLMF